MLVLKLTRIFTRSSYTAVLVSPFLLFVFNSRDYQDIFLIIISCFFILVYPFVFTMYLFSKQKTTDLSFSFYFLTVLWIVALFIVYYTLSYPRF